jgi:hypothetical protein
MLVSPRPVADALIAAAAATMAGRRSTHESYFATMSPPARLVPSSGTRDARLCAVLKGEDIVLLLKLTHQSPDWTVRTLERETTIPRSVVQRSLKRLWQAGLFDRRRRTANISQTEEFLIHGLKYVFPGSINGEIRGFATAWAAKPLADKLVAPPNDVPPVWPSAQGDMRGLALEPLHASVVEAAKRDPRLHEQLTLVDAIRIGDARIRGLAADLLAERLDTVST